MRHPFVLATTVAILAGLTGCKSGGKQLPNEVNVEINPIEQTWTVSEWGDKGCAYVDYDQHQDELVTVRVSDGQGRALTNTEVLFSLSLSANSQDTPRDIYEVQSVDYNTGLPVSMVELYYDQNGDMRPQPEELVSGVEDALFTARTDRYNGDIQVIVRMNLTCTYKASLSAMVGGFSSSAEFSVQYREEEQENDDDTGTGE